MSLISLNNISLNFGDNDVFKNINFTIEKNSRIGLVGINGSGKSTLFNIMTKRLIPHEGEVHTARNIKIAYLTQDSELDENQTLYEYILESRPDFIELSKKLRNAEEELSKNNTKENLNKFSKIQQEFELIDGFLYETEIKLVLTSLNFPIEIWNRKIKKFSGGERTRIQLAKFLLQPNTVMLLDEPTNHLDIKMIMWLEKYLINLNIPYVIVSHDRHFLDNTITKIAEIENKRINFFACNYSNYRTEKQQRYKVQLKEYKRQQRFIKTTKDFIQRNMAGQKVLQAKSRQKMLDKLDIIEKPKAVKDMKMNLQIKNRSGNDVYILKDLSFGFAENILVTNVNLRIGYKDKVAILGKNGCGKTTLLRLLNEEIDPLKGISKKGAGLHIGYYDQYNLILDDNKTVLRTIWDLTPYEPQGYVLSYLAKFGFRGDDVEKKVSILSGGEKSRLFLAKLIHEKPNFLILDEPTNHLDIYMVSNLEKALMNYEGTIIFVSHDRYFIQKVATKRWFFSNKNIIETKKELEELFLSEYDSKPKNSSNYKKNKSRRTNPIILNKILDKIDEAHVSLEKKREELIFSENKFSDNSIFNDVSKVKSLHKNIKILKKEIKGLEIDLKNLEEEYLELADLES